MPADLQLSEGYVLYFNWAILKWLYRYLCQEIHKLKILII